MAELIEKLTMRAYSTAKLMNEHAEEGNKIYRQLLKTKSLSF